MDKLKQMESFVSVATRGSLTAAANAEGVAPAIMGRRLDALEERLGWPHLTLQEPAEPETALEEAAGEAETEEEPILPVMSLAPEAAPARGKAPALVEAKEATLLRISRDVREERIKMSRRRRTIARRMLEATQTTAMLTTFNEIDMGAVMELRRRRKETFKEKYGVSLGLNSFFVKASIGALKEFPQVNAEIDGDDMIIKHYYDIGVAIGATEGLVVPVLRNADSMSFAAIEKSIKDFAQRAEDNTLTLEEIMGGTFTITNGGVFGSLLSTPILNPPQSGILGLHKIEDRPVAGNGSVVIRPMMYVALSYDHRIVDGREAVTFLKRVKELDHRTEVIVVTGHGDMDLAIEALNLDATDFINKPVHRQALEQALQRAEERIALARGKEEEITLQDRAGAAVIQLKGNINSHSEPFLFAAYDQALALGRPLLVLHFEDSASVNGAGVAILTQLLLKARDKGRRLAISGVSENFRKVFEIVGITKLVKLHDSVEAAMADKG
jgi:2-oxoglutarate dehydrogenase E2 component (dihydrolipoamide succinyltransferase)